MIQKTLSPRSDLHKLKVSKDGSISSCLSNASQIKGQLKDLGEIVFDKEIIFTIINALINQQGNPITTREEKFIPFIKLWSICKAKEDKMKNESDDR